MYKFKRISITLVLLSFLLLIAWKGQRFDPKEPGAIGGTTPAAGSFTDLDASGDFTVGATTRVTMGGDTNDDGIVFGSLGTATKGIDLSSSGLSGAADYWVCGDASNFWTASGLLQSTEAWTSILRTYGPNVDLQITTPWDDGHTIVTLDDKNDGFLLGKNTRVGRWEGNGVSNGTSTITDVGGVAHGLSLSAGMAVHISNTVTAADEGWYRIISDDGTSVVLDRALTGSQTDLSVCFYGDVIGVFSTDGTNGQRIMNYSAQDKPLQIGGDVLKATANVGSEDVAIGNLLYIHNADTDPAGNPANGCMIHAKDVTGSSELFALDESGNNPQLTPHNFGLFQPDPNEAYPWSYYAENKALGKKINVDMAGAIRAIEELTGKTFIYYADIPKSVDLEAAYKEQWKKEWIKENTTEVEVTKEEAFEMVEVDERVLYEVVNPKTGKVTKQGKKLGETITGYELVDGEVKPKIEIVWEMKKVQKPQLKKGVEFNETDGKVYTKNIPTVAQAEIAAQAGFAFEAPKWIKDRLVKSKEAL